MPLVKYANTTCMNSDILTMMMAIRFIHIHVYIDIST